MSFLLTQLKRLVLFPIEFFASPNGGLSLLWNRTARSRALLLGLPAILFGLIGISFLGWAEYGMSASLESRYMAEAEKSAKEKKRLALELTQELRMVRASQQGIAPDERRSSDELIAKDDPRRLKYDQWLAQEEVYLEKLIDLNKQEPDYKYRLAIVSMEKGDTKRGLALMNLTAPLDEPGFIKGHLWLAKHHWRTVLMTKSRQIVESNWKIALKHLEQCLKRDQSNLEAKRIKAIIYYSIGDLKNAYPIYEDLFRDDVEVFSRMVEINERMGNEGSNVLVLENAIARFHQRLNEPSLDEEQWQNNWIALTSCYRKTNEFETIEKLLLNEIEQQSVNQTDSAKRVFVERLLATVYFGWIKLFRDDDNLSLRLENLEKAHTCDQTNQNVLLELTRLGAEPIPPSDEQERVTDADKRKFAEEQRIYEEKKQVAAAAKDIYNPANHGDANALVLNEMGSQALSKKQYVKAIEYFENAKRKSPKSPQILNNLSYTYLVCDHANPKRALKLVDEALRFFQPKTAEAKKLLSHFHDTRGLAMMQLNRLDEAAAEFEIALAERPDNEKILKNLVKCYQANDLDPGGWLERLRELEEKKPDVGNRAP